MLRKTRPVFIFTPSLFLASCQAFTASTPFKNTPISVATRLNPSQQVMPTHTLASAPSPTSMVVHASSTASTTFLPTSTSSPTTTSILLDTQLRIFNSLWSTVHDTYIYPDFNSLEWEAIHGEYQQILKPGLSNEDSYYAIGKLIFQLGDEHSYFLDPQNERDQLSDDVGRQDYVGIGLIARAVPERQHSVILTVFSGSPAEAAGLKPRHCIISVNGTPILDENSYLRDIVRGPEGISLDLLIQTPGDDPRELQLTRQQISGDFTLFHDVLISPGGQRIGYIFLFTFMDSTVDEQVAQTLDEMPATAPIDGLILDNSVTEGGSSQVLEPVLGYLTSGNVGYYLMHSEAFPLRIKLNDIDSCSQVPLVLLVGPGIVSFGEIFSGILQDIVRAYLIGTATQGNVEVLWDYDFIDDSQLWLANETFRPLNHPDQDWEKTGIVPNLIMPGDFDQYSPDHDPAIMAALQYLSDQ